MLQQTQVDRVIPYYRAFLKKFPNVRALAAAPFGSVLAAWQGLGYNRRAKMLHSAAQAIVRGHAGRVPRAYSELLSLPGVGDYTAKAVRVFAHNEPEVMIETNIQAVFIHHFFRGKTGVKDSEIESRILEALDTKNPREWYAALMDYGAHLKRTVPNPSRASARHTVQKSFKGSDREIRGAIVRAVLRGDDIAALPFPKARIKKQRAALKREGILS